MPPIDPVNLLALATEFNLGRHAFSADDRKTCLLTKRPDGWWLTAIWGPMNPWHLGVDGVWRYKSGNPFSDPIAAIQAFNEAMKTPRWDGMEAVEAG